MRWDSKKRRYVDSHGHVIPAREVRKEVIGYVAQEQDRAKREAEKLLSGLISLSAFFAFMRSRIEAWHTVSGSIAYGGAAQLDTERRARIAAKVNSEKAYLNEFEDQVRRSFAAADKIASQVVENLEVAPTKAMNEKLTPTQKKKVEKRVRAALLTAAPSEAKAKAKRAVREVIEDEGLSLVAESVSVSESLASDLIGGTIVSRTQMYPEAAYATFQNNVAAREFDSGVTLGRRICAEDEASCDECVAAAADSVDFVPLDDLDEIGSLQCMNNCVVAGTMMGGRFFGGLKALYTGEIINLRTASGKRLTITPNHPVLTDCGFILAGQLNKGDNLITESGQIEPSAAFHNHQQPPAPIEKILTSLGKRGIGIRVGRGVVNLNGDEWAFDGEIQVVSTYGVLRNSFQAAKSERVSKFAFPRALHGKRFTSLDSLLNLDRFGNGLSSHSVPRGSSLTAGGFDSPLPRQALSFASVSNGNPALAKSGGKSTAANTGALLQVEHASTGTITLNSRFYINSIGNTQGAIAPPQAQAFGDCANVNIALSKPATEDIRADTVFLGEIRKRFPGFVASDPIVEILRTRVTGEHVYDLSTDAGWQSANGIIISNCRCEFEFSLEGVEFATSDVFQAEIGGQDAYGGSVTIQ